MLVHIRAGTEADVRCGWREWWAHVERQHEPSCLRMQADARADRHSDSCSDIDAHSCSDIDPDALADRHAHACADIDPDALADRHTHSCADVDAHARADVDVRACLHAPHHARYGPTGTHAQACTMTHTHHGTCPRARTRTP